MLEEIAESPTYKKKLVQSPGLVVVQFIDKTQDFRFTYFEQTNTKNIELFAKTALSSSEDKDAIYLLSVLLVGRTLDQIEEEVRKEIRRYNEWTNIHNLIIKELEKYFRFDLFDELSKHNCFAQKWASNREWLGWRSKPWIFEQGIISQFYCMMFLLFERGRVKITHEDLQKVVLDIKKITQENRDFSNSLVYGKEMEHKLYYPNNAATRAFWDSMMRVSHDIEVAVNTVSQIKILDLEQHKLYSSLIMMLAPPGVGALEELTKNRMVVIQE